MVEPIGTAQTWTFNLDEEMEIEIVLVPPDLPAEHPLRERWDDRAVIVPCSSGSLWMTIWRKDNGHFIGAATFAADDSVARCDTVYLEPRWRGQGIARTMYFLAAYIFKATVVPSDSLNDAGKRFWGSRTVMPTEDVSSRLR